MKIVIPSLCLAASLASLCSSCRKDKEGTDPFINSSWRVTMEDDNLATNPPGEFGMGGSNLYHPWLNCQEDDSFTFGGDGRLHIDAGSTACEGGSSHFLGPADVPYNYDREGGKVTIYGVQFTIAEFTGERLKLYTAIPSVTGFGYLVFLFRK